MLEMTLEITKQRSSKLLSTDKPKLIVCLEWWVKKEDGRHYEKDKNSEKGRENKTKQW